MMNILDIEQAAFASCPANEQSSVPGFILRSNGGYTKRANSANQITTLTTGLETVIESCEDYFLERRQTSVFRLLSTCDANLLDQTLALKGYWPIEKTYVMTQSVGLADNAKQVIEQLPKNKWIDNFYQISTESDNYRQQHLQMVKSISAPHCMAIQRDIQGNIAAQGIGVVENGYFGIFNIVTSKASQRQGLSQKLIAGLMNWAYAIGGHTAYVQVRAKNFPVVALYKKLGYQELYHYWYRVREGNAR